MNGIRISGIQRKQVGLCLLAGTISVLLIVRMGFTRGYSFAYDFCINYVIYFIVMLCLFHRFSGFKKIISVSALLPLFVSVSVALVRACHRGVLPAGLPNLISPVLAILMSYLFYINKKWIRVVIVSLSAAICLFYSIRGFKWWMNYKNFKSISGRLHEKITPDWNTYVNINDSLLHNETLYVLEFWGARCSICYQKFPMFQKFYDKYKNNGDVSIFAVNIPGANDTPGMAQQIIKNKNYDFPVLIGNTKVDSIFGVHVYPTLVLIKYNEIVYRGNFDDLEPVLVEQLQLLYVP